MSDGKTRTSGEQGDSSSRLHTVRGVRKEEGAQDQGLDRPSKLLTIVDGPADIGQVLVSIGITLPTHVDGRVL